MNFDLSKCEQAMTLKGWTQTMLAERAGLSPAVVSNFLNGKRVRRDTAKKIVTTLGLRMTETLKEECIA